MTETFVLATKTYAPQRIERFCCQGLACTQLYAVRFFAVYNTANMLGGMLRDRRLGDMFSSDVKTIC